MHACSAVVLDPGSILIPHGRWCVALVAGAAGAAAGGAALAGGAVAAAALLPAGHLQPTRAPAYAQIKRNSQLIPSAIWLACCLISVKYD